MKALITGAYGFVGKHLATYLVESGVDVVASGRTVDSPGFPSEVSHTTLDILDRSSISSALVEYKPDVIYHLAGISFVPQSEKDFPSSLAINVGGLENLLSACVDFSNTLRCIAVSSAEVYRTPEQSELPLTESHPQGARNKYGLTRICGESVSNYFADKLTGGLITVRPFTHIGVGQEDKFVVASFAKQIAEIQCGKREAKIFVGNLDVQRDFSDVRDIVRAYAALATRGSGIYNLGSGKPTFVRELLSQLLEIADLTGKVTVQVDPARVRPNEMPAFFGDCSKAKRELDWETHTPLRTSLEDMYREWLGKVR